MAFDDTYRESIQTKHIANVGFTSTAKGVTNEAYALKNPHQVLASQIPSVDVVGTYGALTADGVSAGLVEEHIVKLTADPTVNNNKAWIATEDNCLTSGHAARGAIRLDQWMRYAETQYKLRLYEDNGSQTGPNYSAEILPSETAFDWEYDASAGIVYFDEDPEANGKTLPLWGVFYTYVGDSVQDGLGATTSGVGDLVELFDDTNEPSGFVNRTSSTLSFDDATRTLTVSGTEWSYYIEGAKYTKNGAESIQITDAEGMHYIYYDGATITHTTTFSYELIYNMAYVAAIYWDATNDTAIYVGDERHGITMDGQTHAYLHAAFGTQYVDGLAFTSIVADGDGSSADHAQLGVASGHIRDEDLLHTFSSTGAPASIPVYYRDGSSGDWRSDAATVYPMKIFSGGSSLVAWNEWTGATWQQNETTTSGFTLSHIFATNGINNPRIVVQGQAEYADLAAAREGANNELNDLILNGLPFVEFVPLGTLIIQTSTTFTNTPKAIIVSTEEGADYVDWRFSGLTPNPSSVNSHANLIGRDLTDSHPGSAISLVTSNFDGALSVADQDAQTAFETLDDAVQANTDAITALDSELTTASGYLQDQLDALDDTYATDAELTATSGVLQTNIDILTTTVTNNYTTLDNKIDTTSGTLQSEIDALDTSLNDAIIWEVVDTPYDQIRPKVAHQGKAIYTAGNLTIGGDLTVSGTTTTIHSEELTVSDKTITVNSGETGAGITGDQYAGIIVDRGSEVDYMFVFDEVQDNFRVGISGSLQAVATREDSPIDTRVPWWNDSATRFDTSGDQYITVSSGIDMFVSTTNMLSLSDSNQTFGDSSASFVGVSDTSVSITENSVEVVALDENDQVIGVAGDTTMSIAQDTDTVTFAAAGTDEFVVSTAGISLKTGTSVNEIVTDISAASTDDQLATAKAIYDEIITISGTVSTLDHNDDLSGLQGGTTDEYYHLTNNEYSAFSSDGTTFTISQALGLATGTTVNEISTTVDAASTDDQLATAKAVYDYVEAKPTTFIDLTDTINSFTDQRVLFTTASGVVDSADFTFDSSTGTLSTLYLDLETGGSVNEIVTTITSGTTDSQLPTAKAVWDLTEAAAEAVHTHYDVDAVYVSDTSWTYGTGFAAVPDGLQLFVNGVKQRIGSSYDCTVDVPAGVLTITFNYSVRTADWVNVTYYA